MQMCYALDRTPSEVLSEDPQVLTDLAYYAQGRRNGAEEARKK